MDKIVLKNMCFYAHTGCLPEEKLHGQNFMVTVEIIFNRISGSETDRLEDTVNYAMAYDIIKNTVCDDRSNLIEHLAQRVADAVLSISPECVRTVVTVSKPQAPIDGVFDAMEVTVERER
ncbi:MAG: dihydroneopterin aldolase [Saccharofermentans sp.]|jgi:dihydroneopterin aldolase|nr:dihydroneopterin aldolase [Mageeibacillus sp.]MCI1264764.1 dihydroneopterin aldolase [Saccharofermentans sp.]MCI1275868.1 dihydroneopterin aldolase [Saccharofermentans sp.]MCI1769674.1 dihydroneopterin aldolase [Mageeibacillus sp.]MCI2044324.1 dihydroneopterin aldolase [Mageeibacillus sp.]